MIQLAHEAYTKKAIAPAIIDRASVAAYMAPSLLTVSAKVAKATEGAAAKRPAKLLGLNRSPRKAKPDTNTPPIKKRNSNSFTNKVPLCRVCPRPDGSASYVLILAMH